MSETINRYTSPSRCSPSPSRCPHSRTDAAVAARPSPGGAGRAHSRGVLSQLIFPCEAACAATAETCVDTANDAAVACVSGSCAAEITAAQTACEADRRPTRAGPP